MATLRHPVYQAINLRLKIGPADRNMALSAFTTGIVLFFIFRSITAGLTIFILEMVLACYMGSKDPQWLVWKVLGRSDKAYYDPAK
jgi:type IV secretory pathway TrbD component